MACVLNLLLFGSLIHVATTTSDTVECTFDSNESDCFLKQVIGTSTGSFSISSITILYIDKCKKRPFFQGQASRKDTGPDGPYEGDKFLSYSTNKVVNSRGFDRLVLKPRIWNATNYCLKLAYHLLVTNSVDRQYASFAVATNTGRKLFSRGNRGNKWISWATDLDSSSIPSLEMIFLAGESIIGLDSVQIVAKKCGCLKNPCKNGGKCSEHLNGTVQCKCPKGIYGDTCDILGEGSMSCKFEAKEYVINDCFFEAYPTGLEYFNFGKGDKPAIVTGKESSHYIYVDPMSPNSKVEQKATRRFNKFNGNCKTYRLSIDAFMYGENVGMLRVRVRNQTVIKLQGDQGQSWKHLEKEIKYGKGLRVKIQYMFSNMTNRVLGLDNLELTCIESSPTNVTIICNPPSCSVASCNSIDLLCSAEKSQSFVWKNGYGKVIHNQPSLRISKATTSDAGMYSCVVSNEFGKNKGEVAVKVVGEDDCGAYGGNSGEEDD